MLHYLYSVIISLVIAQIYAPQFFDKLVAHLVPLYAVGVIVVFVTFFRSDRTKGSSTRPEYVYRKPGTQKPAKTGTAAVSSSSSSSSSSNGGNWKHQFVGTWDKTERPGFKEVGLCIYISERVKYVALLKLDAVFSLRFSSETVHL
jgi:hypothetical protein